MGERWVDPDPMRHETDWNSDTGAPRCWGCGPGEVWPCYLTRPTNVWHANEHRYATRAEVEEALAKVVEQHRGVLDRLAAYDSGEDL